jgi:4-amino-4-deoxy-L-arabinose transferase-like glycosyltransferase
MREKEKVVLFFILILAGFLRLYRLGSFPALNADEAAIGYNAYSLIETGKDEHGNPWPIHFQSFNDYKPGLYFYLVLPFVKFLGLNEWAVRLPGALLGIGTVWVTYLLVRELRKDKGQLLALLSAFILTISPWHIHFSRGAWEVSVATFFIVLGLFLFICSKQKLLILTLSVMSFALSLYTYHAARVVVPLLGLGLLAIYWDKVRSNIRNYSIAAVIGFVLVLPLVFDFVRPEISSRAAGVGLFADYGPIERINEQRGQHANLKGLVPRAMHNKLVNYSLSFLENWSEHFHGEFFFL